MDEQAMYDLMMRLERESVLQPRRFEAKVAAFALLTWGALLVFALGLGLVVVAVLVRALALVTAALGGAVALLLLLAVPSWFVLAAVLRKRPPAPDSSAQEGPEIRPADAPGLFAALEDMRRRQRGPRIDRVLLVDHIYASSGHVLRRGWPRYQMELGLSLLESLPPEEALALVAHEYGHVAHLHSHFQASICRLRQYLAAVYDFVTHAQGRLAGQALRLMRWYAPYFNAYTWVVARAREYQADAASAELVGRDHLAAVLKRVNILRSMHDVFMESIERGAVREPAPPVDLMERWVRYLAEPANHADARSWLEEALDRPATADDTHPVLRARLEALHLAPSQLGELPPPVHGPSAAESWLGASLPAWRREVGARWASRNAADWAQRHQAASADRQRYEVLRAMDARNRDEEYAFLLLAGRFDPDLDARDAFAAFNAAWPDDADGLFIEGVLRLNQGERAGLALLERSMAQDPANTRACCKRAAEWHASQGEQEQAAACEARWRAWDEQERRLQLQP